LVTIYSTTDIDAQATRISTSQGTQEERDTTSVAMAPILTAVGAVVGAVILLSAIAILILIIACLIRKHKKKDSRNGRDSEMRTSVVENTNIVDIAVDTNLSYIPLVTQITTENNVAYGEVTVNQDGDGLYEIMDPPIEDSTAQLAHVEQSGDEYYDYVN
jgi:hypothetical protein